MNGPDPSAIFGRHFKKVKVRKPKAQAKAKVAMAAPGLTVPQLNKQVQAQSAYQFGPQERAIQAQAPVTTNWYQQYVQQIQQAGDAQRAQTAAAVQGVQNLQSGLNDASKQTWAGQNAQMSADAANRGATVDPGLANVAHNASDVRNMLTGSFGAQLLTQGNNENNYLANRGTVAKQQGIEALGRLAGQGQELQRQKGEYAGKVRQDIITQANDAAWKAADTAFKQAVQQTQLGQSAQRLKQTAAQQATDRYDKAQRRKFARKNSDIAQQNADTSKYRATHPKAGKPAKAPKPATGPGSLTPSNEQAYVSQINTIAGYFQDPPQVEVLDKAGNPTGKHRKLTRAETMENLRTGKNPLKKAIDPRVINVAKSLASNSGRGIGKWGVHNAHKLGIHVNGNFQVVPTPNAVGKTTLGAVETL